MVLIVASLQHTSSYVRLLCRLIIGEIHQSSRNGHFLSLLSAQILRSVLINICKDTLCRSKAVVSQFPVTLQL